MSGKTKSGFQFNVDKRVLGSWEFVEACTQMMDPAESERLKGAVKYVTAVLGPQKKLLEDFLAEKEGICMLDSMLREVAEIVQEIKALKN